MHDPSRQRKSLYKAFLGDRAPSFDTILKVTGALGLKLHEEVVQSLPNALPALAEYAQAAIVSIAISALQYPPRYSPSAGGAHAGGDFGTAGS